MDVLQQEPGPCTGGTDGRTGRGGREPSREPRCPLGRVAGSEELGCGFGSSLLARGGGLPARGHPSSHAPQPLRSAGSAARPPAARRAPLPGRFGGRR